MSKSPSGKKTSPTSGKPSAAKKILSRSEIEEALATKRKTTTKQQRKAKPLVDEDSTLLTPRRQNVIGGDLAGVASRPKSNWMKIVEMGIVNWIVLLMVIAIVGAFFWPQGKRGVVEVERAQKLADTASIETDASDLKETSTGVLNAATGFSRENDIIRADEYRLDDAKALQIKDLLERASNMVANGDYTEPPKANAVAAYNAVLTLDPNNFQAKQGLAYVLDRFLALGFSELNQGNAEAAKQHLQRLKDIDLSSTQTIQLSEAVETWTQQTMLEELLNNAKLAKSNDNLILPAKDNALYFYQQALLIDSDNAAAQNGIQSIADEFINKANQAVIKGEIQTANAHLATVSIIDPEHESISLIEAMITNFNKRSSANKPRSQTARNTNSSQNSSRTERKPAREANRSAASKRPQPESTIENTKTPEQQSQEQAAFDREYLKQGLDAYYRGEYANAAALLQPLADKGIARAQFRLAYMHFLGRGFKKSKTEADRIIRAALPAVRGFAEEGRAWAQSDLGSLYEDGLVLKRDYGEAVYWYRSAAEQGYPGAQTNLGIMYARGLGVSSSRKTAIEWFQRAAKQGDESAKRNLQALGAN